MYMLFLPNAIHLYIIKINLFFNLGELINGCTKQKLEKELVYIVLLYTCIDASIVPQICTNNETF